MGKRGEVREGKRELKEADPSITAKGENYGGGPFQGNRKKENLLLLSGP